MKLITQRIKLKLRSQTLAALLLLTILVGCLVTGCTAATPAVAVPTPVIGEPKVSAPVPQQPGEEVGVSVDISSSGGLVLTYTWNTDGGEIVRGQGSPAITYRVPTKPGTYNVRLTVSWEGHSVERVTSIKVESAALSSKPTGTSLISTDTLDPAPTQATRPTNTPEPPTSTPLPTSTTTPRPTNTPRPTPTPTATIDADLTVYDNFNNPASDGGFNSSLWEFISSAPNQAAQQNGVIVLTKPEKPDDVRLALRKHQYLSLNSLTSNSPTFFEAKLLLDPDQHDGNVQLNLYAEFPNGKVGWFSECGIYTDNQQGWASCFNTRWPYQEGYSYDAEGKSVELGTWHTLRMELDPISMIFTYYIDGQSVGSHTPVDAEILKKAKFTPSIAVWSETKDQAVTGYVDNVRFGGVGQ